MWSANWRWELVSSFHLVNVQLNDVFTSSLRCISCCNRMLALSSGSKTFLVMCTLEVKMSCNNIWENYVNLILLKWNDEEHDLDPDSDPDS